MNQFDIKPPDAAAPPTPIPTSELLIRIVADWPSAEMTVGELVDGIGGRAFSILMLVLTVPIAIPGPPGIPTAFCIPLLIVVVQLCLGRAAPWLPGIIRRRRFARDALLKTLRRVRPALAKLESVCRPRLLRMTDRRGERWLGIYYLFCCIILSNPIPIPFSHNPLAIALSIVALGFVERDGYVIIGGAIAAIGGIVINISLTGGALLLGLKLLHSV
jgi:hypothetical protein